MSQRRTLLLCLASGLLWLGGWPPAADAQTQPSRNVSTGPDRLVPSDAAPRSDALPLLAAPGATPPAGQTAYGLTDPRLGSSATTSTVMPFATGSSPSDTTLGPPPLLQRSADVGLPVSDADRWTWQLLPDGLLYKSYLAGQKESRFATQWSYTRGHGWFWDATLGGRVGLLRYGSDDSFWPEGWQWDLEGAGFLRMDLESERDLTSADFRAGTVLTRRNGPWESKFGYYHLSAHAGDEFLLKNLQNPAFTRINYVRDSLIYGLALRPHPDWRLYGEVGWAFNTDGGARPWEFQFGTEYSQTAPTGILGSPFLAFNGHLRQDNDFSGNISAETGWQWRGQSGRLARVGLYYFNGMSEQYQFFNQFEEQTGVALWYDY